MSSPTRKVIRDHLARKGVHARYLRDWAAFLHGLDWPIINPIVRMAIATHAHPALAAGMVARSTRDENIRATLQAHLEAKAEEARDDA